MKKITKPEHTEHALYYEQYIKDVPDDISVLDQLKNNARLLEKQLLNLTESQLTVPYAPEKWCIKDVLQHLIDCERIFAYRALRFARKDREPLPFFDENAFAKAACAKDIPLKKLLKEYKTNRAATIALFNNMNAATLKRAGMASNFTMSVRACAWIICGHELHHWKVMKERYPGMS
ncbi:MAG: DinB family protein [Chitinophagaceae bacterium]|nr:DinB family protein [Chitinophagaceae bacterium]